jgi:hypothetical protein
MFVLQHFGMMNNARQYLVIKVVPDSGRPRQAYLGL